MKKKKLTIKIFSLCLMIILCVYVIFFGLKKANNYEIYGKQTIKTKIYTVWHIETFEGGGKSRIDYLKKTARALEKENDGVLFMISKIEPKNLQSELETSTPDIISFGFGVGQLVAPILTEFNITYNVRDELISSGTFSNKILAIPYIVSGYALIEHSANFKQLLCGTNGYTSPENVCNSLNLNAKNVESQYEAYKQFVNNKDNALLGTTRDVYRVENLNNIGRTNAQITPVDCYTDLIQYIGKTKSDNITDMFIKNLLCEKNQQTLVDYSLFSALSNKLYFSNIYNDMENAILKAKIPNCFNV